MTVHTSEPKQPEASAPRTRGEHFVVLVAVCAFVIGIYGWSAKSGWLELWSLNAENTYYNLLVQGFRSGQLNLRREVPSGLAQLADPYDPAASSPYRVVHYPLEDLSYYHGKLHLYFGVTPALLLFWPYAALTGHYLLHQDAVVIFFAVGFLASLGLLWGVWRHYFAALDAGVVAAGALVAGLTNFTLAVLQRCDVYEVAISCGYALTMVTLALIWNALQATRRRVWWLAGASLTYGLALGARPSLLFGAVILLVPLAAAWRQRTEPGHQPRLGTLCLAATGPILLIGLGLMFYNYLRFDHPLEFGQRYQLSPERQSAIQQFGLGYLWFNFRVGFLEPVRWNGHFPFVRDIALPPLPKGAAVEQLPFGILTNVPLVWLALAVPLVWRGRLPEGRAALRWLTAAVGLLLGTGAVMILLHNSMCLRYQLEFLPAFVLLAILGRLGLERALTGRRVWQRATRLVWGLLLAFSVSFNLFAMFERSVAADVFHGVISIQTGQLDEAMVQFRKVLKLQPDNAAAYTGLGTILLRQGKVPEGFWHLEKALRLQPDFAQAHENFGAALLQLGKVSEALGHYQEVLRLQPESAAAHYNLGSALSQLGKLPEAVRHWEQALRLKPDLAEAHASLATALHQWGRAPQALAHYQEAVRLKPDNTDVRFNLGTLLFQQGNVSGAVAQYRKALELDPQMALALNQLAWILATETNAAFRNVEEAVRCAGRACELTTNQVATYLDTLGVAYSEAGRFGEAVQATEQASALARAAANNDLAAQIESRLELYQARRPYHEAAASKP